MSSAEKAESWFKTEITLGQAVTIMMTILTLLIGSWINVNGRITAMEIQFEVMKQERTDQKDFQKQVLLKLNQIELNLMNKQDRK